MSNLHTGDLFIIITFVIAMALHLLGTEWRLRDLERRFGEYVRHSEGRLRDLDEVLEVKRSP